MEKLNKIFIGSSEMTMQYFINLEVIEQNKKDLEKAITELQHDIKNERNAELKNAMIGKLESMEKLLAVYNQN